MCVYTFSACVRAPVCMRMIPVCSCVLVYERSCSSEKFLLMLLRGLMQGKSLGLPSMGVMGYTIVRSNLQKSFT